MLVQPLMLSFYPLKLYPDDVLQVQEEGTADIIYVGIILNLTVH